MNVRQCQAGIALLLVLWVLVLFSAVAVSYAYGLRTEARMTRNQLERARAEALAEAGVARALQVLRHGTGLEERYGRVDRFALVEGEGEVAWQVRNAAGFVNLNSANAELLRLLFEKSGANADEAEAISDAVLDWRDEDDLRRLAGAEDSDYSAAGLPYGAADTAFGHRAELLQVLGMSPALYARVAPHLVVQGSHQGVNARHASRELLLLLEAAPPEQVEAFVSEREAGGLGVSLETGEGFAAGQSAYVVIDARGSTASGALSRVRAVVRLRGGEGNVPSVVEWLYEGREEENTNGT